jgi:hypothetical protein
MAIAAVAHLCPLTQRNRHESRVTAETGIDDEAFAIDVHRQEHVRARGLMLRHDHDHTRGVRREREAELLEDSVKQHAVLEAVAAATGHHELRCDAVEVDADAAAEQHIDVFERNARDVRTGQAGQRLERRLERTLPSDAGEVGGEIKGARVRRCEGAGSAWGGHRHSIKSAP